MAVNLTSLSPITTAATALSNLVLVTPNQTNGYQPQNSQNNSQADLPPSLLFHYEGEQSVRIESDITDHYVEDNTAINDQIALKPELVSTEGFIGELNDIAPPLLKILNTLANKLTVISAYEPVISTTALLAYNQAFQLYQVAANAVNVGVSAWATITGQGTNVIGSQGLQGDAFDPSTGSISNNQSKQQVAFQQFYGYWRSRTLFTVQTPWAVFQNMAIKDVQAIQDAETRVISSFKVTFKMVRFASTQGSIPLSSLFQGRALAQAANLVNLGTSTPKSSISLATGLSSMGVA